MSIQIKKEELFTLFPDHDITFFAGAPVVYHCHHYNLFLDQTIDDALGSREGTALRTRAAHEAFYHFLHALLPETGAASPAEKLQVAEMIFAAMGHGTLKLRTHAQGGEATGDYLHYGFTWKEKYGGRIRRRYPADAVASGCAAAATELAYDLPFGSLEAVEESCVSMDAPRCRFQLRPTKTPSPLPKPVSTRESRRNVGETFDGSHDHHIRKIMNALRNFLGGVSCDERGLVQGFGVFVTLHLASYYNRISYDALYTIERTAPQSFHVMEGLLREAGHACGFNTFGGLISSPEWESLFGPVTGDPLDIITYCCGIGRALGFGHWAIHEFEPERRLVIRTPSSYESTYHVTRHGLATTGRCYLHLGAAIAMMNLAHRVPWNKKPTLDQNFYQSLYKEGTQWQAVEASCVSKGDEYCEFVVERA